LFETGFYNRSRPTRRQVALSIASAPDAARDDPDDSARAEVIPNFARSGPEPCRDLIAPLTDRLWLDVLRAFDGIQALNLTFHYLSCPPGTLAL
jgi:hypothetical protein